MARILDTDEKLMEHMGMGTSHAPSFYAVKEGVLKPPFRNIVIVEFRNFLQNHGLRVDVLPFDKNEFVAFVVGARVMSPGMARRGLNPSPMTTATICADLSFNSGEAAEIALALESQCGAMFIELENRNVEIPKFLPNLPIFELYAVKR